VLELEREKRRKKRTENADSEESRGEREGNCRKHWCFCQVWVGEDQSHNP